MLENDRCVVLFLLLEKKSIIFFWVAKPFEINFYDFNDEMIGTFFFIKDCYVEVVAEKLKPMTTDDNLFENHFGLLTYVSCV